MSLNLNLPKANGLFITGTDTGVGKTLVSGAIARILGDQGHRVGVFKPIASGCRREREGLVSDDTEFLAMCANCDFDLSVISPVTFQTPAAPAACEVNENKRVDFEAVANAYRYLQKNTDFIIAEGIGGAMVPLSENADVMDLAVELQLPVVIVARPDLGTINHSLMTVQVVRNAGLPVAGIIISGYNPYEADYAEMTAPDIIAAFGHTEILAIVPFDEQSDVEEGILGEAVVNSLEDFDWHQLGQL